mmetsp:Transcript_34869/g.104284  ORF Transcript_34869/g.104284 Transcript_34869/m.104284 type:complete len:239 (+) Transcript_34869:949-1665(+)
MPGNLQQQPRHRVSRGVVPCEEDQKHVAVGGRRRQAGGVDCARQGPPDRATVGGQRHAVVAPRGLHDGRHGLAQGTQPALLEVTHERCPDLTIRCVHELLGRAEERELQLRLGLVQQEVAHIHWPGCRCLSEPGGTVLGTGEGGGQDLCQRGKWQEDLRQVATLHLPVVVVCGRKHAVIDDLLEVALLADVSARDAFGIGGVPQDNTGDKPALVVMAIPKPRHDGDDYVAAEPSVAVL